MFIHTAGSTKSAHTRKKDVNTKEFTKVAEDASDACFCDNYLYYISQDGTVISRVELFDTYKVNPDPKKAKDTVSRSSYLGNGTRSMLNQIEGEIYRDASMRIINLHGESAYEFRKVDYSKVWE